MLQLYKEDGTSMLVVIEAATVGGSWLQGRVAYGCRKRDPYLEAWGRPSGQLCETLYILGFSRIVMKALLHSEPGLSNSLSLPEEHELALLDCLPKMRALDIPNPSGLLGAP